MLASLRSVGWTTCSEHVDDFIGLRILGASQRAEKPLKGEIDMKTAVRIAALMVLAAALLALAGCTLQQTGPTRTDSKTVDLAGADSVRAEILMGAGELEISGGASALMNAEFTYNVPAWKPEVDYSVTNKRGRLIVEQPSSKGVPNTANVRYEWDVRLNNDVPMELTAKLGAGESHLDLRDLSLTTLEVQTGAGEVDLAVPAKSLTRLTVTAGVGDVTVDMTGDWKQDLKANLKGGVGTVTLRLPEKAGVRVSVEGGLGSVKAYGFNVNGRVYTNEAYGKSDMTLEIEIAGGIGEVRLELGD